MVEMIFWGNKGEYGPFNAQEDGWPNAGEVVRYYRRERHMSAKKLAELYGEAIGEHITARWILKMEQQNKIPLDITRRRALANILSIPLHLIGLTSLEHVTHNPIVMKKVPVHKAPPLLEYSSFDLDRYDKEARIFWKLHYAQTAQDEIADILLHIHNLVPIQQAAQGAFKQHISELTNSYYRLAATIQRDHGNFEEAYTYANESVRFAKFMGDDSYALQVVAASQYTRGVINLAWGAFGNHVKQGNIIFDQEKIEAAIADFERALKKASPQLKGIIYSEMSRATALLATSSTDVSIALKLIEQAEPFIGVDNNDDFYTQILLNGDLKGLDKRRLILGRAKTFLAVKRPAKAMEELAELDMLKERVSHPRRRAWTSILSAQAAFDIGSYAIAVDNAVSAFGDCREAHSITHLARVNELYTKLLTTPYRNDAEVKGLGRLLNEAFPKRP